MQQAWYLDPKSHQARRGIGGAVDEWLDTIMYPVIVWPGVRSIAKRQSGEKYTGVSRFLWDRLTLLLHGFTVMPDPEWAFRALDMTTEVGLSHCSCRKAMAPDLPLEWKCLGLGVAAGVTRDTDAQPFKDISREQAKDLVATKWTEGCFLSIGWRRGAYANWMCLCDQWCGGLKTPELEYGMTPSIFVMSLTPRKCDDCQACVKACHFQAFRVIEGKVIHDQTRCHGCGQCTRVCPTGALDFVPRERYFDIRQGGFVEVPRRVIPV